MSKKYPLFRVSGSGTIYFKIFSPTDAIRLSVNKYHHGITRVTNKLTLDNVINHDCFDEYGPTYHESTEEVFDEKYNIVYTELFRKN